MIKNEPEEPKTGWIHIPPPWYTTDAAKLIAAAIGSAIECAVILGGIALVIHAAK
jgi:hypothetical protein